MVVEILECGEDREQVLDGVFERQDVALTDPLPKVAQALSGEVLHDDVARVVLLDKVEDLNDIRVFQFDEESALGDGGLCGIRIVLVEQAFQDDPAVIEIPVAGQVDPPQAAMS